MMPRFDQKGYWRCPDRSASWFTITSFMVQNRNTQRICLALSPVYGLDREMDSALERRNVTLVPTGRLRTSVSI